MNFALKPGTGSWAGLSLKRKTNQLHFARDVTGQFKESWFDIQTWADRYSTIKLCYGL